MLQKIGYKHTFTNENIYPQYCVSASFERSGYDYHFILYPTGLILVINIPGNERLDLDKLGYNPYTNTLYSNIQTSLGAAGATAYLYSITPKHYQFTDGRVLTTEGQWTRAISNSQTNAHYKWGTTTDNVIHLEAQEYYTSAKIRGAGQEYNSLPDIYFIDSSIGTGQTIQYYSNSFDYDRYPLYKEGNGQEAIYYETLNSTFTEGQNLNVLTVNGDCFSHSNQVQSLDQFWTKGYASKNILRDYKTTNPPIGSNYFIPAANSPCGIVTDNCHGDPEKDNKIGRYLTGGYGVQMAQLSTTVSDDFSVSFSYNCPTNVEFIKSNVTKNNPGVLGRNDQTRQNIDINKQCFGIDQFVFQVSMQQFKIPLNGQIHIYVREGILLPAFRQGNSPSRCAISPKTTGDEHDIDEETHKPWFRYAIHPETNNVGRVQYLFFYEIPEIQRGPYFSSFAFDSSRCHEYVGENNTLVDIISTSLNSHGQKINVRLNYQLTLNMKEGKSSAIRTNTETGQYAYDGGIGVVKGILSYNKKEPITLYTTIDLEDVPYPLAFVPQTQLVYDIERYVQTINGNTYTNPDTTKLISGPKRLKHDVNGGEVEFYRDRKPHDSGGYTQKTYLHISQNVAKATDLGLIRADPTNPRRTSLMYSSDIIRPTNTFTYYQDSEHDDYTTGTFNTYCYQGVNGNEVACDVDFYCDGETPDLVYIVAYPED